MISKKLWLWRNSTPEHPHEWWAFDNPFPVHPNGDPMTLGEPWGYILVKDSTPGRSDWNEQDVLQNIERASSKRRGH